MFCCVVLDKMEHSLIPHSCAICGLVCDRLSTKTSCCDGCRQFFRRIIVNQRLYSCIRKNCANGKRLVCRSCRFDRCLSAGMDWHSVRILESSLSPEFRAELENRKRRLKLSRANAPKVLPPQQRPPIDDLSMQTARTIGALAEAEKRVQLFFAEDRQFDETFLRQFGSLSELLASFRHSFIGNADKLTVPFAPAPPSSPSKGTWKLWSNTPHPLIAEICVVIDLFRSMPVSTRLYLNDQAAALNGVGTTALGMLSKWRSASCHSDVIIYCKRQISMLDLFHTHYRDNETIQYYADYIYQKTVANFNAAQVTEEEYLFLRAIVFCHSAISELSRPGQMAMQSEAERYSRELLHLVQSRHGSLEGAKRYAQLLHLLECAFHSTHKFREFLNFMAMVAEQGLFHAVMPAPFVRMCLQGGGDAI